MSPEPDPAAPPRREAALEDVLAAGPALAFQTLVPSGETTYVTPNVEAILGYSPSEVIGVPGWWEERLHPDDRPVLKRLLTSGFRSGRDELRYDLRVRHRKGHYRWLRTHAAVEYRDGRAVRLTAVTTDVTGGGADSREFTDRKPALKVTGEPDALELERARVEERRLGAQRMDAIGRLSGGIAHDFNNLLMAIRGNADLAASELEPDHPVQRDLKEIRSAADRATRLTKQLLAFSRRQVLRPQRLDLNVVVREMEDVLRRLAGEGVVISTDVDERPAIVDADPAQLQQVILDLAVNAVDAMPEGGTLTLRTSVSPAGGGAPGSEPDGAGHVMLTVEDSGAGMDPETLERAFEPYFTTKGPGRGTGLGLSTVYGIVKQSGGSLQVESAPGQGTEMRIRLPLSREDESVTSQRAGPAAARAVNGPRTILVADDDGAVLALAHRILTREGFEVLPAPGGPEALLVAGEHEGHIDLLLTDVVMPDMTGRELAERLAQIRPETPVLYMSGYDRNIVADGGVLSPGTAFLNKPFSPEELVAKVSEVLGGAG